MLRSGSAPGSSGEDAVLDTPQGIHHALGADVGIQQAQRGNSAERGIDRLEPIDGRVQASEDLLTARHHACQTQQPGRLLAVEPALVRRARVRSGMPTAFANSSWDRWVSLVRASTAPVGMPRRMTATQSSAERGMAARTR